MGYAVRVEMGGERCVVPSIAFRLPPLFADDFRDARIIKQDDKRFSTARDDDKRFTMIKGAEAGPVRPFLPTPVARFLPHPSCSVGHHPPALFLLFSLTDDDDALLSMDAKKVAALGTIVVSYRRIKGFLKVEEAKKEKSKGEDDGEVEAEGRAAFGEKTNQPVHERARKAALSHQAKYVSLSSSPPASLSVAHVKADVYRLGAAVPTKKAKKVKCEYLDKKDEPFVVFEFRYRRRGAASFLWYS